MDDDIESQDAAGSSWGRKFAWIGGALVVVLIVAYFTISSSAFIKGVILPRVSKSLNADVTVGDVSLSPFSQLTIDHLKVQPPNAEPLLTADQVRVRYRLLSILRGNYIVDELSLTAPTIQLITAPDGTSNLDPLSKGQQSKG